MTQEDIIRMADKVGFETCRGDGWPDERLLQKLKRFFRLAYESGATAQREKVAAWMRSMGYATGHGDTVEDLLDHLGTQIAEGLLMEREACAKVCETLRPSRREFSKLFYDACTASADSIRARGNK
jgi:hypothetical protein